MFSLTGGPGTCHPHQRFFFVFFAPLWIHFIFSHGRCRGLFYTRRRCMLCQAFSALLIWLPPVSTGTYKFKTTVRSANRQLIATLVTGHVCRAKASWPQRGLISNLAVFSLQPALRINQAQLQSSRGSDQMLYICVWTWTKCLCFNAAQPLCSSPSTD